MVKLKRDWATGKAYVDPLPKISFIWTGTVYISLFIRLND